MKELQHVAIVVQDLAKERQFYEEVLGFQVSEGSTGFRFRWSLVSHWQRRATSCCSHV